MFDIKEALEIQSNHLTEWKIKLNTVCYSELEAFAKETNDSVTEPHQVRRGYVLSDFVLNWKPKKSHQH